MDAVGFASRIKQFRQTRGLSQEDLAKLLGVTFATVLRWETGTSRPATTLAKRLEEIGFGTIDVKDTKHSSIPRINLPNGHQEELRKDIRQSLNLSGHTINFDPVPYVINGPTDQLEFYEKLYSLQEISQLPCPEEEYIKRLSLVAHTHLPKIVTAQYLLEKPKASARSWNSNYGSHGWHRYIGRFPSHLVRALLNHFGARRGDTVLDPFLGSGTTLVESRLIGTRGIGIEISPLSALISRAKSQFPSTTTQLGKLLVDLDKFYRDRWSNFTRPDVPAEPSYESLLARSGQAIPYFPNLEKWFSWEAFLGTSIVVEFILTLQDYERDFVACALSGAMRSIGNLDVDVVRAEYRKEPRSNVDVLKLVTRAMRKMINDIEQMLSTHSTLLLDAAQIQIMQDSVLDVRLPNGSVDFVITSPPYGVEASSYFRTHLLSYRALQPILNYDPYVFNERVIGSEFVRGNAVYSGPSIAGTMSETFSRFFSNVDNDVDPNSKQVNRKQMMMQFFDDMAGVAQKLHSSLRTQGRVAFVIGNKRIGQQIIPTDAIIGEIFQTMGLQLDQVINHKLKTNNSNSEVPWQERIIQDEFVMFFTKVRG